jgi:hypothetical protein
MKRRSDSKVGNNPAITDAVPHTTAQAPNPRRVLAGRLNRQKRGELAPEGRERLRQSALQNRPWRFSTGPTSTEGKAAVARNGKACQKGPTSVRAARREARVVRELIRAMRDERESAI